MRRLISSMGVRRYYSLGFKSFREGLVCLLGASFGERRLEVDAGQGNAEVRDPWLVEGPLSHELALALRRSGSGSGALLHAGLVHLAQGAQSKLFSSL
jgi:hypothetical protein